MRQESIKKNYLLNTVYQLFSIATPFITAPYISRVFGPEGVGVRSYTTSIVSVFTIIALLGTSVYGQQVIAQCRDDFRERSKNFWEIEILCLITSCAVIVSWLIFVFFSGEYRLYFLILTMNLIASAFDITWFFAALEQFSLIVARNLSIRSVSILLLFTLIKEKDDLALYMLINAVTALLASLSLWIPLSRHICRVHIRIRNLLPHFRETMIYFLPTIAATVYSHIDKTMIGIITRDAAENGYYEQAQQAASAAYTVVASINTVMASRIAYLFARNREQEIRARFDKSGGFLVALSFPLAFGICGTASNFVLWFFGPGYEEVVFLMILCSPLVILLSIHNFLAAQYLVPSGQRVRSTKGVIAGAAVNFVLNLILIPGYGAAGAVVATVVSEAVICGIYFYMSKDFIPLSLLLKYMPGPLAASTVMLAAISAVGANQSGRIYVTFLQVIAGAFLYLLTLLILKDKFTFSVLANLKIAQKLRIFKK